MKELTITAQVSNLEIVTGFVDEQLETLECPMKAQIQIDIAIDEIFSNIANYAYAPGIGNVTIQVEQEETTQMVKITFIDGGIPYNPLSVEEPDTTLSADKRPIGGLGIFMVKKSMDEMLYEYKDGKNILTIKKQL